MAPGNRTPVFDAQAETGRSIRDVRRRRARHGLALATTAVLAATVLVLTVSSQIYDANHLALTNATALLAGDRLNVDVYDPGFPLLAYLAAGTQILAGQRLIGEFARQWLFIIAGVVIACHLALRLSRSAAATAIVMAIAVLLLGQTPTYHSDKLLFFPLAAWLAWRYIEQPNARRGAAVGAVTALAFLFRHDFGLYLGCLSLLAFGLARLAVPESRHRGRSVRDAAAYAAVTLLLLTPWAASVQATEGLVDYFRVRVGLYEGTVAAAYPRVFDVGPLRDVTPLRYLIPRPPPPATPATVAFSWDDTVTTDMVPELERRFELRYVDRDARGRNRYWLPNAYDVRLLDLDRFIADAQGFDWDRLHELASNLPARDSLIHWLLQMSLLVPVLLVAAGVRQAWRATRLSAAVPLEACLMLLAGSFLIVIDVALLRQPSYFLAVAPLTAALGGRLLVVRNRALRACTIAAVAVTAFAAVLSSRNGPLDEHPGEILDATRGAFAKLTASPPDFGSSVFTYMRDCAAAGDRVLVSGSPAAHVSYYVRRPIAGGHILWHSGWRSDPVHERRLLALLERQSVPFAFSTHSPILDDLRPYPLIHEHFRRYYSEVEGSGGSLLVDARRRPTGTVWPNALPCFR